MLAMFSPGPKSRTTAACLAIFLGWAGIHKLYLGYRNAAIVHVALTLVGVMALAAQLTAPAGSLIAVYIAAWALILFGYVYVRRFHFGHTLAETVNPARVLLWPWRLLRYTFRLVGVGSNVMDDEEEEQDRRRWRRRRGRGRGRRWGWGGRRGRRHDDDDDDDGRSFGCVVVVLGIILSLAVVALIVLMYILILSLVGPIALAASVAIGVAEGIRYLSKTDHEFQQEYVVGQRLWF